MLLVTTPFFAQQPSAATGVGVPYDWSHHHLLFSQPPTASDALKLQRDPRYWHQWYHRNGALIVPATDPGSAQTSGAGEDSAAAAKKAHKDWSMDMGSAATVGPGNYPAKYSFYASNASCSSDFVVFNTGLGGTSSQASIGAYTNLYSGCTGTVPSVYWAYDTGGTVATSVVLSYFGTQVAFMQLETITMSKTATATATGVALTIGGTTGFVGNTTSGSAVLTLTTGTLSSSGQSISGSGIPSSTTVSSVASASLNILTWKASTTQTFASPDALTAVAASSYYNCTAPCFTSIPFGTAANDTNSSPFYDYLNDLLYVGDDNGVLHKFQHVFKSASGSPPAEVTSSWPVTMTSGNKLTSPVFDSGTSQKVFVGDSGGYLYSVPAAGGSTIKSSQLAISGSTGIVDGPVVNSSTEYVYVWVGQDGNTVTNANCDNATGCDGVFRFSITSFTSSGTGTCSSTNGTSWTSGTVCGAESVFGSGSATTTLYDGTFDNTYYSGSGTTGNLWTCAAKPGPEPRLNYSAMSSFPSAIGVSGSAINPIVNGDATCSPVSEVYNGTNDYIFLSVTANGNQNGCTGACLYNFNVTSSVPSGATAGLASTGGTSGIIIDNIATTPTGASEIYYSSLGNQNCATSGGTGGCAVQASQAAP